MNNKELLSVALKVFAIYILVQILMEIPRVYGAYVAVKGVWGTDEMPLAPLLVALGAYSAAFLLARSIWNLSKLVVTTATADAEKQMVKLPDNIAELMIMTVGLFVTVEAIFGVTSPVYSALREIATYEKSGGLSGGTIVWGLSVSLKGILGFTLIIKPKGWIGVMKKLRTIGTEV